MTTRSFGRLVFVLSSALAAASAPLTFGAEPKVEIGYCTSDLEKAKAAGFDYAELGVRSFASLTEEEFAKFVQAHKAVGLKTPTGNVFLPNELKVVGPDVDEKRQMDYVRRAFARAQQLGLEIIVFGSGGARKVPEGFSKEEGLRQLVAFAKRIAPEAAEHGIVVAVEPLRREETNIINTEAEGLVWVEAVNHPSFQLMVDFYHLASEKEDPQILVKAAKHLRHVHIANPNGRVFPLGPDEYDYSAFFENLRKSGYRGRISVEAATKDLSAEAPRAIAFLRSAFVSGVKPPASSLDLQAFERGRILKAANAYLAESPVTVTASRSPRSAGGPHDFFSEADYWWPDPDHPDGPYVQRDGQTNPDNFVGHRKALMRLSVQVPALAAAWQLTRDSGYAAHAARHLRAWFLDEATRMAPHLRYAQAIHGRVTGRGTGIIDTLHLVEVARAIEALEKAPGLSKAEREGVLEWFAEYLRWMTTDPNGIEEREAKNNHGTCWVLQVAAFARLTGNVELLTYCRDRFKTVLVPNQMAPDGSFLQELRRTKPYGYSLFNLEAMAGIAQMLSTPQDDLWTFELPDGRGLRKAMAFMVPYIRDKKSWSHPPDVMYDGEWPMRQASLLFAGLALKEPAYVELWKTLKANSNVDEVIRNFFIRQPVLWVQK